MKSPILILVTLLWFACNSKKQQAALKIPNAQWLSYTDTLPAKEIAGNFNTPSNFVFDSTTISMFLQTYPAFNPFKTELLTFYRKRNFAYAWHLPSGLIEQSYILYNPIPSYLFPSHRIITVFINFINFIILLPLTKHTHNTPTPMAHADKRYILSCINIWLCLSRSYSIGSIFSFLRKK